MKHDLGNGWAIEYHSSGTAAIFNTDKGKGVALTADQVSRLTDILGKVELLRQHDLLKALVE